MLKILLAFWLLAFMAAGYGNDTLIKNEKGLLISYRAMDSVRYDSTKIPVAAANKAYRCGSAVYLDSAGKFYDPFGVMIKFKLKEMRAVRSGDSLKTEPSSKENMKIWRFNPTSVVSVFFLLIFSISCGVGLGNAKADLGKMKKLYILATVSFFSSLICATMIVFGNRFVSGGQLIIPSYFLAMVLLSLLFKKRIVFYKPGIKKSLPEKTNKTAEK